MVHGRSNAKEPRLPVPPKSQNIGISLASDRTQRHYKPVSQCTAALDRSSTPTRRHTPRSASNFAVAGIIARRKTRSRNSTSGMHAVAAGLLVKWSLTGLHRVLPGFHRQAGQEWASRCSRRRTRLSLAPRCTLVAPPLALCSSLSEISDGQPERCNRLSVNSQIHLYGPIRKDAFMLWITVRIAALITALMSSASAEEGLASRYGRASGTQVACGGPLNENALTAAHRSLPCGSRVRVTRRRNGKSVVVTINDRGPFVRGRVVDLTPAAARAIRVSSLTHVSLTME
jgi:rare lipoprotein A